MATAKRTVSRQVLDRQAAARGWRVEGGGDKGYRVVSALTGTLIAGKWSRPRGFGLTAAEVDAITTSVA